MNELVISLGGWMRRSLTRTMLLVLFPFALLGTASDEAQAYIDPGTTGILSQVLYVLFYGALGVFFFFLRSIKRYVANAKQTLKKLLGWGI